MLLDGTATAAQNIATQLGNSINSENLLAAVSDFVPVILGVVIFAFVYRLIKKLCKGASKGKINM